MNDGSDGTGGAIEHSDLDRIALVVEPSGSHPAEDVVGEDHALPFRGPSGIQHHRATGDRIASEGFALDRGVHLFQLREPGGAVRIEVRDAGLGQIVPPLDFGSPMCERRRGVEGGEDQIRCFKAVDVRSVVDRADQSQDVSARREGQFEPVDPPVDPTSGRRSLEGLE